VEVPKNAGSCQQHSQPAGRGSWDLGSAKVSPTVWAAVAQRCLQTARPGGSGTVRAWPPGMSPALCRQSGAAPHSNAAHAAWQKSWAS